MTRFNPGDYPNNREGGGDLIPAGKHTVQVRDHELSRTSGGHGQIVVTFEDRGGRTRKGYFIYEGRAGFQTAQLLSAFDWHGEIDLDNVGEVRRAIYGKNAQIVVEDEVYQGKATTKIKYVNKAPSGTPAPPPVAAPSTGRQGQDDFDPDEIPF